MSINFVCDNCGFEWETTSLGPGPPGSRLPKGWLRTEAGEIVCSASCRQNIQRTNRDSAPRLLAAVQNARDVVSAIGGSLDLLYDDLNSALEFYDAEINAKNGGE